MGNTEASADTKSHLQLTTGLQHIASCVVHRVHRICENVVSATAVALVALPAAFAMPVPDYTNLNTSQPNYNGWVDGFVDPSDSDGQLVLADVNNFVASQVYWSQWRERANHIRSGDHRACIGNLSVALSNVGSAYQASGSGATTLLTLLPTTGALIGAPAKELWVLYKLCPVAGVLSMALSLGGNIVPTEAHDYENIEAMTYGGLIGSTHRPARHSQRYERAFEQQGHEHDDARRMAFSQEVSDRADSGSNVKDPRALFNGTSRTTLLWNGVLWQLFWIACIIVACWILQTGGIIVWWCRFWPWMHLWYLVIVIASWFENAVNIPFTKQYTLRVARAPKARVSPEAPWVVPGKAGCDCLKVHALQHIASTSTDDDRTFENIPLQSRSHQTQTHQINKSDSEVAGKCDSPDCKGGRIQAWAPGAVIEHLDKGYNTYGQIILPTGEPWAGAKDAFYVIISVNKLSAVHGSLRFLSRLLSIASFVWGTALFASSTLITIIPATVCAGLVIAAGIFGRLNAMWMASWIMSNNPILHRVVESEHEADQYVSAVLGLPDLLVEIKGHVVLNGQCVARYKHFLRPSTYLGVLAKPFNIMQLVRKQ